MTRFGTPAKIGPSQRLERAEEQERPGPGPGTVTMTPPNILTILRVILVPVFILFTIYGYLEGALAAFLLAGLTDLLDGLIARAFDLKSQLGMLLDPIADKLLLVSSFIVLSLPGLELESRIPIWLAVTVISRDVLLVTSVVLVNLALGKHVFPPSLWGKLTTAFQLLAVLLVLIHNSLGLGAPLLQPVFFTTLALTVFSGLHYLVRGRRMLQVRNPRM